MNGKCRIADCAAPDVPCHIGCEDYNTCENFEIEVTKKKAKNEKAKISEKKSNIKWTGEAFSITDLPLISNRTSPTVIGVVGKAAAGKATFLAMLYTLLLSGKKLSEYDFAGTKTVIGWDELHHLLRLKKGEIPFPPPTPVSANRLYHFALRDKSDHLRDVLFSDASGEVFSHWSVNREDPIAETARWIYKNSSAFMLFIDCVALIEDKNLAKREILRIAKQLSYDLKDRPVLAVWSKSDRQNEVLPGLIESLKKELKPLFNNFDEIQISNFLEPGPDELVHKHNIQAVDWLLSQCAKPFGRNLEVATSNTNDLFLNYRGK